MWQFAWGIAHFEGEQAVDVLVELLEASGYLVRTVGIIEDPSKITYSSYSRDELRHVPRISCTRNSRRLLWTILKINNASARINLAPSNAQSFFVRKNDSGGLSIIPQGLHD